MGKIHIKAILLDFGDTLVSTDKFDYDQCLRKVHESLTTDNITVPYEEYKNVYFNIRNKLYKETEDSLREAKFSLRITETLKHFGYSFRQKDPVIVRSADAFADAFVPMMQMEPYVPKLLKQLKTENKYKIGLVSNFALPIAVKKTLERFDIAKYFDALTILAKLDGANQAQKSSKKRYRL
jgi:FMN phosphatase YigB (HAD superfamily)